MNTGDLPSATRRDGWFFCHADYRSRHLGGIRIRIHLRSCINPGNDVIVDNFHVVAWDSHLNYSISTSTAKSSSFLAGLVNSVTSGEGIVNRFSGNGKVYVCSRNRNGFLGWIASKVTKSR